MSHRFLQTSLSTPRLSQKLYLAESIKHGEVKAAQAINTKMYDVMCEAGEAVFKWVSTHFGLTGNFLVLVGTGNNGGDGYVTARLLRQQNCRVTIASAAPDKTLSGDALTAQQAWLDAGGKVENAAALDLGGFDVIIDAIFGSGLTRELDEPYKSLVQDLNNAQTTRISIDIPSGIHADTGKKMGVACQADATITLVGKKLGTVTGTGKQHCGELVFAELSIGNRFAEMTKPDATLVSFDDFAPLSTRQQDTHKGNNGKLLLIGGNAEFSGAIRLSAEAALRTGAGLVKVFCHANSVSRVVQSRQEVMATSQNLNQLLDWADCIVFGPGLGQDNWSRDTFNQVFSFLVHQDKSIVIDADGLNLLSSHLHKFNLSDLIITPHSAEAARLMGVTSQEIDADRYKWAKALHQKYGGSCVLKGAGTIIENADGTFVCADGNPGMATGGMGDVLSGVLGSLLAQGMSSVDTAVFGTCLHSAAADIVAQKDGPRGMIASDLFPLLRQLVN